MQAYDSIKKAIDDKGCFTCSVLLNLIMAQQLTVLNANLAFDKMTVSSLS